MKDQDIAYIVEHKKRKLEWDEYFDYIPVLSLLSLIFLSAALAYHYSTDRSSPSPLPKPVMIFIFCVVFIGTTAFLMLVLKRLRQNVAFKSIKTPFSKDENYKITVAIYEQQKIEIQKFSDCIVCDYGMSLFSWGGKITILPLNKEILINSHPTGFSPTTIMKDVNNVKRFEKEVNEAITKESAMSNA